MLRSWTIVIAILLGAGLRTNAFAAVFHVPSGPTPTIASALTLAQDGDVVEVSPGTYFESNLELFKAITLVGVGGPAQTIIDAQGEETVILRIFAGDAMTIEGLTLTGGAVTGINLGMNFALGSPQVEQAGFPTYTIRNCVITGNGNLEEGFGGGIAVLQHTPILVEDCIISNNESPGGGGFAGDIFGSMSFVNCVIRGNRAKGIGGAGAVAINSFTMVNCTIVDNETDQSKGGGLYIACSEATIENCQFLNNAAAEEGGGIFAAQAVDIQGSVFRRNRSEIAGGGVYAFAFSPIERCTFAENEAPIGGAILTRVSSPITRCIVAYSTLGEGIRCSGGNPLITCCDVFGNAGGDQLCGIDGGGNFSLDPLSCDLAGGDLSLHALSPCLQQNYPTSFPCEGTIGALEIGCGFPTDVGAGVEGLSWGRTKDLYR